MNAETRRNACLAASLACAWTAVPAAVDAASVPEDKTVYTRLSWFHSLAMVRLVVWPAGTPDFVYELGAMPAGDSFRTVHLGSGGNEAYASGYAFVAVGKGSGGGDDFVDLCFADTSAAASKSFESLFPDYSEAAVARAMLADDDTVLYPFLYAMEKVAGSSAAFGAPTTGVHFSNGVADGSTGLADFSPVPEPGGAAVCLAGLGAGALLLRRRPAPAVAAR